MKKLTTQEFIEKSIRVHGNKFDYSQSNYVGGQSNIKIICPLHGVFYQRPNNHLNGSECYRCGRHKTEAARRYTELDFIKKARKIHKNRYVYNLVRYRNSKTKVKIKCNKCLNTFEQIPADHLRGIGCHHCNSSKGELQISEFLKNNNICFTPQKSFSDCINPKTNKKLKFDFYIPSKKLLIEFDGKQHFVSGCHLIHFITTKETLKEIRYKDRIKTEYARKNNISLLRIKYTQLKNIKVILSKYIIS